MKTPLDPVDKDLAVALGNDSRRKRADHAQGAEVTDGCAKHRVMDGACDTQALALIERALMRLASGSYGICVSCGAEISLIRLDHNPATETCAKCDSGPVFKAH